MKNIAKITIGSIILLYAIYGYSTGEIYELPSKYRATELLVTGDGLVYCVLSYVAFAFIFYVWSLPSKKKHKTVKRKIFKTPKEVSLVILAFLGIALQAISGFVD